MKKRLGFTMKNLDQSVRPQDDFFQYAGGGWLKKNPIPKSESTWGTFYVLRHDVLTKTHALLKEIAGKKRVMHGSTDHIVRNFYLSGMDMKTRNKRGLAPLRETLTSIQDIRTKDDLFNFIFAEHKKGAHYVWNSFVGQDDKDAETYIFHIGQGGLSLPDRDYYVKSDQKSERIRNEFLKYVEKLLVLSGMQRKIAERNAQRILALETKMARASMTRTDAHEIEKVYNKKTVAALKKLAPRIPWNIYLQTLGVAAHVQSLTVLQPKFFQKLSVLFETTPLDTWKAYLYFAALDDATALLSDPYIKLSFSFHGKVLSGNETMRPLWKQVSSTLDQFVGEAVGKKYIERYFLPEAKKKINDLVDDLFVAYKKRIQAIDWMSPITKKKALKKLSEVSRMLGYPDRWKSYRGLKISPDTYFENVQRAIKFEQKRNYQKLGKKVDRKEWHMPPQTVNAYYSPNTNQIVFPAGILQPPFFDSEGDDATNYGAMGSVIGHELTHAFDDSGAKFDGHGNYKNWWTKKDRKRFDRKAQVLVRQYNEFMLDDQHVNGKLTLGENIADLGGLAIAYDAYQLHLKKNGRKIKHGFTPEQRYFLGLALFEITHARPEYARMLIMVDPHSPPRYRVNGPFSNLEPFYKAFNVQKGDALYREPQNRAKIW